MSPELPAVRREINRWNSVSKALAAEPRRQLIFALDNQPAEEQVLLPEAAATPGLDVDDERLIIELQHQHLPLLDSHDFVRWTTEPFCARRGPRFDEVASICEGYARKSTDLTGSQIYRIE